MLGLGRDFIWKLADGEDSKLVSQNNHLVRGLVARFFSGSEIGEVRKQSKKTS